MNADMQASMRRARLTATVIVYKPPIKKKRREKPSLNASCSSPTYTHLPTVRGRDVAHDHRQGVGQALRPEQRRVVRVRVAGPAPAGFCICKIVLKLNLQKNAKTFYRDQNHDECDVENSQHLQDDWQTVRLVSCWCCGTLHEILPMICAAGLMTLLCTAPVTPTPGASGPCAVDSRLFALSSSSPKGPTMLSAPPVPPPVPLRRGQHRRGHPGETAGPVA